MVIYTNIMSTWQKFSLPLLLEKGAGGFAISPGEHAAFHFLAAIRLSQVAILHGAHAAFHFLAASRLLWVAISHQIFAAAKRKGKIAK